MDAGSGEGHPLLAGHVAVLHPRRIGVYSL